MRLWPLFFLLGCVPGAPPITPSAGGDAALKDQGVMGADQGVAMDGGADPMDAGPPPPDSGPPDTGSPGADIGPTTDTDGDGIPDGEDPDPGYQNPLLFSDTFDDNSMGWLTQGSMSIHDGPGFLRTIDLEPFEREGWINTRPNWADVLIRATVRINSTGNSTERDSTYVAVIGRVSQITANRYVACGVDVRNERILLAEYDGTSRRTLADTPTSIGPGDWVLINLRADRDFYTCTVSGQEIVGQSNTYMSGATGFRTYDATFDADWIEVYELALN